MDRNFPRRISLLAVTLTQRIQKRRINLSMITLRVRSRDGLERVEVPESSTIDDVKFAIEKQLGVPTSEQTLSLDQGILLARTEKRRFTDLSNSRAALDKVGLCHGTMVYLLYDGERKVHSTVRASTLDFGSKTTIADLMARQTRIKRQETAHCLSCHFDSGAAIAFQEYWSFLGFKQPRVGFLYGTVEPSTSEPGRGSVRVEFIYEPPQDNTPDQICLTRNAREEKRVEHLAKSLGMQQVGIIFAVTDDAELRVKLRYKMNAKELMLAAELHNEFNSAISAMRAGESEVITHPLFVVAIAVRSQSNDQVSLDTFELSDQCLKLSEEGWFSEPLISSAAPASNEDPKLMGGPGSLVCMRDGERAVVDGVLEKYSEFVDIDYFLNAVPILQHEGMLSCRFPVENRLIIATTSTLETHIRSTSKPYVKRISDFHLLLFLSAHLDANDMSLLADAVRARSSITEGYQHIINDLAGIRT